MSNWQHTTLGEIASIITGPFGSQLHQADYVESGIPIVMPQNIDDRKINYDAINYICEKDALRLKKYRAVENDILYARRGDIEKHAFISKYDDGVYCGTGCLRVRVFSPEIDPLFLSFFLNKAETRKWLVTHAVGSNMPNLNTDILAAVPVSYPSIEKQRQIAQVLNSLDEMIAINSRVNDNLQQMAKTIYEYWFLQFEFPDSNGKPYRSSGGSMMWNEQLKCEVPVGWKVTTLKGLFNIERGISYTSKEIEDADGIPMINLANVDTKRNYKPTELKYFRGKITEKAKLGAYDLLIACTDLTRNADIVGCPILVPDDSRSYIFSMDMAKITSASDELDEMYLYMTLRTDFYHDFIKRWASGTNVLHLNLDGLDWYTTWLPPVDLQQKYSAIVRDIHKQQCILLAENERLTLLRNWLLPMLMNGQTTVAT